MLSIIDKKILTKYVSSFLLGDGYLSSGKKYYLKKEDSGIPKNSKYEIKQLDTHEDYILWQKEILENITGTRISYKEKYVDSRGYSCNGQIILTTKNHPFFTEMRKRIYGSGRKSIDQHYMKLFDWETLAILYMDNGWIENTRTKTKGIRTRISLATHAYSSLENKVFRDFLASKFGIHFDINTQKSKVGNIHYYLRCSKDNAHRFLDGISKYIFPSFYYKLDSERLNPIDRDKI